MCSIIRIMYYAQDVMTTGLPEFNPVNRDISGILEAFWKTIMGQPVRTGLDPRELGNCSGPQGLGDMRLEKLLSICQPITQQWHATGSFGTLGRKDKRRPGTLEHHSPSFIARIHGPILTFRRSLDIL